MSEKAQLTSEKAQLERTLASIPEDVRAAQTELQKQICNKDILIQELTKSQPDLQSKVESLTTDKQNLQSQLETLQLQVWCLLHVRASKRIASYLTFLFTFVYVCVPSLIPP